MGMSTLFLVFLYYVGLALKLHMSNIGTLHKEISYITIEW